MSTSAFRRRLGALALLAVVLRVGYLLVSDRNPVTGLGGDGWWYHAAANKLAAGSGFVAPLRGGDVPTAFHPPLWPLVLSVPSWFGASGWFAHRLVGAAIGTATVVVVGLAGRRIAGARAGLIAAGIAALYPGLWSYEREVLSETLLHLGIACLFLAIYRFRGRPSTGRVIVVGAVVGALALTRSEEILAAPFVVVPIVLTAAAWWGRRFLWLAAAGAMVVLVIAPWIVYNAGRQENLVVLSNNFGPAMAAGDCDTGFSGDLYGYYDPKECASPVIPTSGDESSTERRSRTVAVKYVRAHLSAVPGVVAARIGRSFALYRPVQTMELHHEWTLTSWWVLGPWLVAFWALLVAAVYGVIQLRRRRVPISPFIGFAIIVVICSALAYGSVRLRAALEVPVVLLTAVTIDALVDRRARRSSEKGDVDLEVLDLREEHDGAGFSDVASQRVAQNWVGPASTERPT